MADIANVTGVRSGTQAYTQGAMSSAIKSTIGKTLTILAVLFAYSGNKTGADGIGTPKSGLFVSNIKSAQARQREIFGAEAYYPLIHTTSNLMGDGKSMAMHDTMPGVGAGGGAGAIITTGVSAGAINAVNVIYGGTGYSSAASLNVIGGAGTGAVLTPVISGGVITSVTITTAGSGYTLAPAVTVGSAGTSHDQHFERPFFKPVEFIDPILIYNKPSRRLKNLLKYGLSKAEKEVRLASFLDTSVEDAKIPHMLRWSYEFWGIATTSDAGPTSQSAEVWDHLLSCPSACSSNNTFGGVDRTITANAWWKGNRVTAHRAAVASSLFDEAAYTLGTADIGMTPKVLLCGPSNFPKFVQEFMGRGGAVLYKDGEIPGMGKLGFDRPVLQYMDMWIVFDPICPDKLRTDPRTGSAYTKNAVLAINPDTYTLAFEPEANFTVTKAFDLSQLPQGVDAKSLFVRTELMMANEAPAGNAYWEDVG